MAGESPSPLVLTAPLMPPCAHTECERRQGTKEKTSTLWPASAILMTVINPASPPPTTMKRGLSLATASAIARSSSERSHLCGVATPCQGWCSCYPAARWAGSRSRSRSAWLPSPASRAATGATCAKAGPTSASAGTTTGASAIARKVAAATSSPSSPAATGRNTRSCARSLRQSPTAAQQPLQRQEQRGQKQRRPRRPQLDVAVAVDANDFRLAEAEAAHVVVGAAEVTIGNIRDRAQQAVARLGVFQFAAAAAHQEHLVVGERGPRRARQRSRARGRPVAARRRRVEIGLRLAVLVGAQGSGHRRPAIADARHLQRHVDAARGAVVGRKRLHRHPHALAP